MKIVKIESDERSIHLDCPNCDNWEQLGIDDKRSRLNALPITVWLPDRKERNEFSLNECTECNTDFIVEWDYTNHMIGGYLKQ